MRIPLRKFNRGLYVSEPAEGIPDGALVRARGIDRATPWKSRQGSTALVAGNAHSIIYFNDYYFYSTGTTFYASTRAVSAKTSLSGNRLSFARMAPRAGYADALYACDGTNLFKTQYHEVPLCSTVDYLWNVSGGGTDEYYLTDTSGDQSTGIVAPLAVYENDVILATGTLGALASGTWGWGDADTLGFNTLYVRLADSTTPAPGDHQSYYLHANMVRVFNCGITAPSHSPNASSGLAGGNLTGLYTYCCTFKNSHAGVRSNPSPTPSTETGASVVDSTETDPLRVYEYSFLWHCDGAENATTGTDVSGRAHGITFNGACELDTTETVFGTAALYCPGASGDYVSIAPHGDWWFSSQLTVDFRAMFEDFTGSSWMHIVGHGQSGWYWNLAYNKTSNRIHFNYRRQTGGLWFTDSLGWDWTAASATWYHVALIRGWGGNWKNIEVTIDGSTLARSYSTKNVNYYSGLPITGGNDSFRIGGGNSSQTFKGWIDEVRIINNIAAWTEEFTPVAHAYGASTESTTSVQYNASAEQVLLSNIPVSNDPQVDTVEIWRTQGNGAAFFRLTDIPNGQATYTDNTPDDQLGIEEVPTDNIIPHVFFDDLIGPHNGAMFWLTRNQDGERGRLYYSAVGRAETMRGFIEVSSNDDPLQKLVYHQGMLGVFSQSRFFQILGSDPYFVKEVSGVPGTRRPHSVVATPYGIAYEASDRSFRLLSGLSAARFDQNITRILTGEAVENLKAWGGGSSATIATYARGEYIISDSSQTLAYDLTNQRWRDLGLACTNLFYNPETDQLIATVGTNILEVEKYGEDDDNGTGIEYAVQTASLLLSDDKTGLVQHVHVDCDTNGETITADLVYGDSSTKTLGTIETSTRTITSFPVNVHTRNAGVRLTGTLSSGTVALYGIDMDVYIPGEEKQ